MLIRQHNLIRDLAYRNLQEERPIWVSAHRKASEMWKDEASKIWRNEGKATHDAPNIEKIRGYLEAFYHLSEIEDWKGANGILRIRPNRASKELVDQLGTWGYYSEQIEIYRKLCDKYLNLDSSRRLIYLKNIGVAYGFLDDYENAFTFFNQALKESRRLGKQEEEAKILHRMGISEADQGNDNEALNKYYQSALKIYEGLNNSEGRDAVLSNIARVEANQGKYKKAISYYHKILVNYQSEDNIDLAWIYFNLGAILGKCRRYKQAQKYLNRSREVFESRTDNTGIAWCHLGLANVKLSLAYKESANGDAQLSLEYEESAYCHANQALTRFDQPGNQNQTGIASICNTLGRIEFKRLGRINSEESRRKKFTTASKHYRRALLIWRSENSNLNLRGIATVVEAFACLLTRQQQPNQQSLSSPYLFGVAEALRDILNYPIPPSHHIEYELGTNEAKEQIGEAEFSRERESGKENVLRASRSGREELIQVISEILARILAIENEN